jgi:hypothetical protein
MTGVDWIKTKLLSSDGSVQKVYKMYNDYMETFNGTMGKDSYKRKVRRIASQLALRGFVKQSPEVSPEEMFERLAEEHDDKISNILSSKYIDISVPDTKPIGIVFTSDWHLESQYTNLRQLKNDMKLIAETDGLYQMQGGDIIDNAIKHLGMMTNGAPPSKGLFALEHILEIAGDSMLAMIGGNHDNWTKMKSGLTRVDQTIKEKGISYRDNQLVISLNIDEEVYQIALVHKYRFSSYLNPTHKIKRMWENFTANFDIGVVGHDHVFGIEEFWRHSEKKIGIRPGTYQVTTAYGEEGGYNESTQSSCMVVLYPNEHRMVSFSNIHDGIVYLKAVRGE